MAGRKNPVRKLEPRYAPASDPENEAAHKQDLMGAELHEFRLDPGEADTEKDDGTDEGRIQSTLTRMLEEAVQHYEEELEPDQKEATDYYYGRPFGDEEEGRSKVVSTDVRDAVLAIKPSLMRIFCGTERAVEYRPKGPEDEQAAQQATDFITLIVREDNPGYLVLDAAFDDALVRRLGIVKYWYEEFYRAEAEKYTGLSLDQLLMLASEESVSDIAKQENGEWSATVTRKRSDGCFKIAAIPPEEFVYTPNARCLEEAPLVAHVREVPADELIGMGIDEEVVNAAKGKRRTSPEGLKTARHFNGDAADTDEESERDEATRPVLYAEAFALIDGDGDGIAERRLFQCVGPKFEIVNGDGKGEIVDGIPFADFTPTPQPHTVVGLSTHDLLKDVQRVKSQILRATLNSLSLAVEPKTEVVTGEVNMADLLNPEIQNIIRVRRPGMMREVKHQFVGPDTMPMLGYYDEIKESRTGQSKASAGLDADALQSSTKAAVSATLSQAQQRIEYIARVFAETGMKKLFKGLLKLVVRHQNRKRMVRLRGKYVEIDPRSWDATMDVSVNVALGAGMAEDKLNMLMQIASDQMALIQAGSPLVSPVELRNTRARFVELLGFKNADEFYKPWGQQEEQQMQQMQQQQPPPPDPAMMLVEVEKQKLQLNSMVEQAKLELQREKMMLEDDRERDKLARDHMARMYEIEVKHGVEMNKAAMNAQVEADRVAMDADLQRQQMAQTPTAEAA